MRKSIFGGALVLLAFLSAGEVYAAVQQTKFNPGPYVISSPSGSLSRSDRHAYNLNAIKQYGKESYIRGVKVSYRWADLESSK
ncbi:MAG: hypothetical protein LR017_03460 [Candidatus Pacebacteria bacterium]|nr:hypothetical protein [Candidatus Paceibacterota bacterium]